jgi:hypothetical protein
MAIIAIASHKADAEQEGGSHAPRHYNSDYLSEA